MDSAAGFLAGTGPATGGAMPADLLRQFEQLGAVERMRSNSTSAPPAVSPITGLPSTTTAMSTLLNMLSAGNPTLAQVVAPGGKLPFLAMIAEVHNRRSTPLPPELTGVANASYDPSNSVFRTLELGGEQGVIRIQGQEIDLFKLWQTILTQGFSAKINQANGWPTVAAMVGLQNVTQQTTLQLQQIASYVISPFEQFFIASVQNMRRNTPQMQGQPGLMGNAPTPSLSTNADTPSTMTARAPTPSGSVPPGGSTPAPAGSTTAATPGDEQETRKRKAEAEEEDESKRTKRKLEEETSEQKPSIETDSKDQPAAPEVQVLRRKIEYVPNVRALSTHGGRDLALLESEVQQMHVRRPTRPIEEYGPVDIEWLTMCLRSGIRVEIAYALSILYHLSWLRSGAGTATGLPMATCDDMIDVLLDLLEGTAFGEVPDEETPDDAQLGAKVITNKEIARAVYDREQGLFAGLEQDRKQGPLGPQTPPWEIICIIVGMFSNLSSVPENPPFFAATPRLLDVVLRVCMLEPTDGFDDELKPASPVLKLHHLLRIRKEAMSMIALVGSEYDLARNPPRTTRRLFALVAATLMDSEECHSPSTRAYPNPLSTTPQQPRPPSAAVDLALDAFSRVSHPDGNRTFFTRHVPADALWSLIQHLSRLLPVTDQDIAVIQSEAWLSFITKVALSIYSLVVLAPTSLRRKMRSNPGLRSSLTRFMRACTRDREGNAQMAATNVAASTLYRNMAGPVREIVENYWRRIVEILRVIDEEEDLLATLMTGDDGTAGLGTVGFGIGGSYGEHNSKPPPRGTGLLGGVRSEFLWGAMWQAAYTDPAMFEDWENLVRVDSATASLRV